MTSGKPTGNASFPIEHDCEVSQAEVGHNIHHPTGWWNWRVIMNLIIVGASLGLFSYDNSFAAPLLALPLFIIKYQGHANAGAFTARNLDLIVTVPLVGAAIGTFAASPLMKYLGRKKAFLVAYIFFCVPGSFLQLFAPNLGALVCGRFWNYFGVSILTTTAPLYLSELVPAHVRGRAVGSCIAVAAGVGVLATTAVWGSEKLMDSRQYMIPLAIQAALPCGLALMTLLTSESPAWHVFHGDVDQARRILKSLRANNMEVVSAEISMHQVAAARDAARTSKTRFWDILDRANIKRTLTAGAVLCLSQVGGQILILQYSTVILVQSGVANPFQITVIITCLQFLGTLIGPTLLDKIGRRSVALSGLSILFLLNIVAGSLAATGLTTKSQQLALAAVFIIFAFFNAICFQSLCYLVPTEVAAVSLSEPTMSWALFWSYTTAIITTFAVPQITSADAGNLGAKAAFIFGGCVFVTIILSYFYLPETKNRSLAEIDEMYAVGLPMSKWKKYKCQSLSDATEKVQHQAEEVEKV